MQKKSILILTLICLFNTYVFSKEKNKNSEITRANHYYKLKSPFLQYLDGVSNRLDGSAIDEIMQVRKMIQDLRVKGIIDEKTKKCLNHSIQEFVKLESDGKINDLVDCLKLAKENFIDSTIKFMRRIEGTKKIVIKIMEESCELRNIKAKDTVMFEWANTQGNEKSVFNAQIKSFKEFDKFLHHVYNFLGDLLKSCPKGFKQYKQSKKQSNK